jgi:hypothetical protein
MINYANQVQVTLDLSDIPWYKCMQPTKSLLYYTVARIQQDGLPRVRRGNLLIEISKCPGDWKERFSESSKRVKGISVGFSGRQDHCPWRYENGRPRTVSVCHQDEKRGESNTRVIALNADNGCLSRDPRRNHEAREYWDENSMFIISRTCIHPYSNHQGVLKLIKIKANIYLERFLPRSTKIWVIFTCPGMIYLHPHSIPISFFWRLKSRNYPLHRAFLRIAGQSKPPRPFDENFQGTQNLSLRP